MKIGSININGVNAFANTRFPGAWEFFGFYGPDVLCIQETKGNQQKVENCLRSHLDSYSYIPFVSHSKGKAGYAGVALFIKKSFLDANPYRITSVELTDFMDKSDPLLNNMYYYGTGRIIQYESDDTIIISVYVLNSGGKEDLRVKWDVLFTDYLKKLPKDKKIYVLGDFNVCEGHLDMWNWGNALNTSPGLMQFEIDGFHKLIEETGFVDTFRNLNPDLRKYSWSAPKVPLSKGWRLDYILTNRIDTVEISTILSEVRASDHVYVELITK